MHQLLKQFNITDQDRKSIEKFDYTFIIDEVLETCTLERNLSEVELKGIINNNWATFGENKRMEWMAHDEQFIQFRKIKSDAEKGGLYLYRNTLMWRLPIEIILAMPTIYVLTFMHEASHLLKYLQMNGLTYSVWHIEKNGLIEGCQNLNKIKEKIRNLITVYEGSYNLIGEKNDAFTASYWKKGKSYKERQNITSREALI